MDSTKEDPINCQLPQSRTSEYNKQTIQDTSCSVFLPIIWSVTKAAVVLGNENTKSLLITKADKVTGEIDVRIPHPWTSTNCFLF